MSANRSTRVSSTILAVILTGLNAGCVNGDTAPATVAEPDTAQPRLASYDCGADGAISIENAVTSIRVTNTQGDSIDLPASPPGQDSRYGADLYAIVLDDREALFMKAGASPIACRR